jgi:hypothetical protein
MSLYAEDMIRYDLYSIEASVCKDLVLERFCEP